MPERHIIVGWDIGGAHVKACLMHGGEVLDVAQWPCTLWRGLEHLDTALQAAWQRWPQLAKGQHAVTMTGEMTDLFADRQQGVLAIAGALGRALDGPVRHFAGDAGWRSWQELPAHWAAVASANWLATAQHAARVLGTGVLVDIGSTTTDVVAFQYGRVASASRSDAERLASGELVYHGAVRTPLCALGPRIAFRGQPHYVMNEFFATSADVYRLLGELDPAHDQHPSADNAAKDAPATRRRLARMIGLDARDATDAEWLAFARAWRARQVEVLADGLRRVMATAPFAPHGPIVSAGCGAFLVDEVAHRALGAPGTMPRVHAPPRQLAYGRDVARVAPQATGGAQAVREWAQVCAPCVAVAALLDAER